MPNKAAPFVLAVLAAGLFCMFAVSLYQRVQGPGLVLAPPHNHPLTNGEQRPAAAPDANMAARRSLAALAPGDSAELNRLMTRLQASPHDVSALLAIAAIFSRAAELTQAENFLQRARQAAPDAVQPLHLLGLNYAAQKKYPEAAASFEAALGLGPNPSVAYSLAVLYGRYMHTPEKAVPLLQDLLASPDTPQPIRDRATEELAAIL